ncbi:MAG: hypothetical protein OIF58_11885 [Cohaesibacter sp.]|nr:hypothetical protein [Cohaesibacter sp.]
MTRHFSAKLTKATLIALSASLMLGCSGGGVPTPPGLIAPNDQADQTQQQNDQQQPQSIMASLPPDNSQNLGQGQAAQQQPIQQQAPNNGLPPASSLGSVNQATTAPAQPAQPAQSRLVTDYTVPTTARTFLTFEPMVGAPTKVARELSGSLGQRVAQQALPVVARSDEKVTHRVKGYFSASENQGQVNISYVWDIFDKSGKRLNRITGSQQTPMVGADPWDAVTGPILDKVAVDTAAQLKTWHASL